MVLIASALASALAWIVMRGWLDNFAYRATQTDPVFALRDE